MHWTWKTDCPLPLCSTLSMCQEAVALSLGSSCCLGLSSFPKTLCCQSLWKFVYLWKKCVLSLSNWCGLPGSTEDFEWCFSRVLAIAPLNSSLLHLSGPLLLRDVFLSFIYRWAQYTDYTTWAHQEGQQHLWFCTSPSQSCWQTPNWKDLQFESLTGESLVARETRALRWAEG